MKKLLFSIVFLTSVSSVSFAQRYDERRGPEPRANDRRSDDRWSDDRWDNSRGEGHRRDDRFAGNDRDFHRDYDWGYDAQYNRISRSRNASRMINSFQQQARERIAWGISRGLITGRESKRLLEMADRIEWKENRFMRNGRLSPGQAQELKQDLMVLDRMITHAKSNGERQVGRRW